MERVLRHQDERSRLHRTRQPDRSRGNARRTPLGRVVTLTAMSPTNSRTVSVVTGANSGIGRAVAIHLATQGHEVYGTVRHPGRAAKLEAMAADVGVSINLVELDVADDDSVRKGMSQIVEQAGQVDVLVNNAGIAANAVVEEATSHQYLDVMN